MIPEDEEDNDSSEEEGGDGGGGQGEEEGDDEDKEFHLQISVLKEKIAEQNRKILDRELYEGIEGDNDEENEDYITNSTEIGEGGQNSSIKKEVELMR